MTNKQSIHYWNTLPDRDETLEIIYGFIRAIHEKDPAKAGGLVMVKDMELFINVLHDSLKAYLNMVIEDESWEEYETKNLAFEVDDPIDLDEDLMIPEFSGRQFVLSNDEKISVQVGMRGQVTPIRIHFALQENEGRYYIKIQRITAK